MALAPGDLKPRGRRSALQPVDVRHSRIRHRMSARDIAARIIREETAEADAAVARATVLADAALSCILDADELAALQRRR